jgi:hypothetical protein
MGQAEQERKNWTGRMGAEKRTGRTGHTEQDKQNRISSRVAEPENLKTVPVPTFYLIMVLVPVPAAIPGHIHAYTYTYTQWWAKLQL